MPGQEFYSDEEAEQILHLAVSRSPVVGGVSRESLLQSAQELGISPQALAEAEMQLAQRQAANKDQAEFDAHQRGEFLGHLWSYLAVNAMLVGINYFTDRHFWWVVFPILGWGMGILTQAIGTFSKGSSQYKTNFETWQRRRDKRLRKNLEKNLGANDALLDRIVIEGDSTKLAAIKRLREEMSVDLREAKEIVDDYARRKPDAFV